MTTKHQPATPLPKARKWEALINHPRPMGRPFMRRWVGPIFALSRKAAMETAQTEARLSGGWKVALLRELGEL